ncbi:unnamed protein product [Rodentolepis nana]|uniref:Homeobox domain-containing protein n=1 Tax=Rodentolepis nana TaxID=102285 RepID=A0A0R3TSR8_RODNA|nr:unnamed protein product [Rodentolepis nana]
MERPDRDLSLAAKIPNNDETDINVEKAWSPPVANPSDDEYPRTINYQGSDYLMPPSLSSDHSSFRQMCYQHTIPTGVPRDEPIAPNDQTNGSYSPHLFGNELSRPITSNSNSNPVDLQVYEEESNTPSGASAANGGRRKRKPYTRHQIEVLEAIFQKEKYIGCKRRKEIGEELSLSERQVKVWFQNRRMKAKKQRSKEKRNINNGSVTDEDINQDGPSNSPLFDNPSPLKIGTSPQGVHHTETPPTLPPSLPPYCSTYQNSPFHVMPTNDYAPTNMFCPTMPSDQQPPHFQYNAINTAYLSLNSSPGVNNAPREITPDSDRSHGGLLPPSMNGMGRIPDVISRQLVNTNDSEDPNQINFNQLPQQPPPPQPSQSLPAQLPLTLQQQSSYLSPAPTAGNIEINGGHSTPPVAHANTTYSGMMENTNETNRNYEMIYSDYLHGTTFSYSPPAPSYLHEANSRMNIQPNANMQFTSFRPSPDYLSPNVYVQSPLHPLNDYVSSQPIFLPNSGSHNLY